MLSFRVRLLGVVSAIRKFRGFNWSSFPAPATRRPTCLVAGHRNSILYLGNNSRCRIGFQYHVTCAAPVREQARGFRCDLPLIGIGQRAPLVHVAANLVDEGVGVVLLRGGGDDFHRCAEFV